MELCAHLPCYRPAKPGLLSKWNSKDATDESSDVIATRKIFELLEMGLRDSDYRLQIIVTEHADERTLSGIHALHMASDWHGKDKDWLIPRSWIND